MELKSLIAKDGIHCSKKCPYLKRWAHPFYYHTAWCWKTLKDLSWYDGGWLIKCDAIQDQKRTELLRNSGRTKFSI